MNGSHGTKFAVTISLLALLCQLVMERAAVAQPATDAQVEGATNQNELRWKPHRIATATPAASADAPQSTDSAQNTTSRGMEPARSGNALPPASVSLPDGVPTDTTPLAVKPRGPAEAEVAPLRGALARSISDMGDWFTAKRTAGAGQAQPDSQPVAATFPERFMRSPQGEAGRPILTRETGPGMTNGPAPAAPLGGGLAPRYAATQAPQRSDATAPRRADRLAMNVDGLPSVMMQAPQAAAIDETPAPGRLPTANGGQGSERLPVPPAKMVDPPIVIDSMPMEMGMGMESEMGIDPGMQASPGQGLWMGQYPAELHVESFYDDPYACDEEGGVLPLHCCDGRICAWMRQFGKPYYGWRWYRDFTASAGVTAFQNETNLGLFGNYGTNEYLNWAMPLWNAFGIGWQVGVRGVQSNFQRVTVTDIDSGDTFETNARDQVFVTTGFFTRAFEGRGLQGGAVYDYLHDSYFNNVDLAQIRAEMSYVWGYHELGFWGAFNLGDEDGLFGTITRNESVTSTEDLYTAFYRLHFGDANEMRVWGGATGFGDGIVGSSIRAPMTKSFALEGAFTYLIPGPSNVYPIDEDSTVTASPSAWNVSLNLVYYPARRSRRSLASPYRPLFDVADNGSLIRSLTP